MHTLHDILFDKADDLIAYMYKHDNEDTRKAVLKTDRLRKWYCCFVCLRESVFELIEYDGSHRYSQMWNALRSSNNFLITTVTIPIVRDLSEGGN